MKTLIALLLTTSVAVAQAPPIPLASSGAQIVMQPKQPYVPQSVIPKDKKWQSVSPDNMPIAGIVPATPTREQKIEAFKKAFESKNWTDDFYGTKAGVPQQTYKLMSGADDAHVVKTEKIIPVAKAEDLNDIDRSANLDRLQRKWVELRRREFADDNVCPRHSRSKHCRKVTP